MDYWTTRCTGITSRGTRCNREVGFITSLCPCHRGQKNQERFKPIMFETTVKVPPKRKPGYPSVYSLTELYTYVQGQLRIGPPDSIFGGPSDDDV